MSVPRPGSPQSPAPGAARADQCGIGPRIILVGKTGLDRKLRGLGPVRVRVALDAIGELADPGARADGAPVVVVSGDADPSGPGQSGEFVRALRRVEPAVRILRVGGRGDAGAYDGIVWPEDPIEATLAAILDQNTASRDEAPPAQVTDAAPPPAVPQPPDQFGDAALAAMLLRGRDIIPDAVDMIRQRTGQPGVTFVPDTAPAASGVEVVWNGHRFGRIIGLPAGDSAAAGRAAHFGTWLGAWLALAAQQERLRHEAFTDALTSAWNRRYFDRFMESALHSAQQSRHHLTVLVFDIDGFKRYNDEFGHAAGDAILVETVRLLQSVIRPSDKVCRIGGDEFAVIFHEPDGPRMATSKPPESIFAIAQRFQRQICAAKFPKLGVQAPGTLTISGGLATFPWDGRTAAELLARADELAIQGKRSGKNTIVMGPGAAEVCGTGEADPR